jgi:N-acetylglucosamine kinase-like BadF-type ATPase
MGLAGVDHPFQYHALMQRLTKRGLERLEIFNDGFIVVKAGSQSGAAIGLNCGTGTCCNAIDRRGRRVQLAGLGDFSGDIANGTWIAIQAFRLVYDDCILGLEPTLLKDMIFREYEMQKPEDLLLLLAGLDGEESGDHTKTLIRLFFAAANAGDAPVLRLVDQMALRGAQLIAAHLRELDFPDPAEVVLSGSIHTKLPNKPYLDALMQKAEERSGRKLQFHLLEQPPVMGCIQWIMQEYAG